jgi:hypothetical protein
MAEKKKKKTLKALNRYKNRANELAAVLWPIGVREGWEGHHFFLFIETSAYVDIPSLGFFYIFFFS